MTGYSYIAVQGYDRGTPKHQPTLTHFSQSHWTKLTHPTCNFSTLTCSHTENWQHFAYRFRWHSWVRKAGRERLRCSRTWLPCRGWTDSFRISYQPYSISQLLSVSYGPGLHLCTHACILYTTEMWRGECSVLLQYSTEHAFLTDVASRLWVQTELKLWVYQS